MTEDQNNRNMKIVGFAIIGVFSMFAFFMISLFGKYLLKIDNSKPDSKQDTGAWMGTLAMIVLGTLLVFMILF
jgi:hypothetical protein